MLDRDQFDDEVTMWVFQESVDGKNLTDIINTEHENVKYLPVRAALRRGIFVACVHATACGAARACDADGALMTFLPRVSRA